MSSPLVDQAKQQLAAGRHAQALETLARAPPLHQDNEALQLLALVAIQVGQGERALQAIDMALAQRPDEARLHALGAAVAHAGGDAERARGYAERAFALDPGEDIAASVLVEYLTDRFAITPALQVAHACLQRKPDAWGVRLARVFAWMSAGEAQRAMEDAEFARSKAPQSMPAKQNVAMCALYLDESAEKTLATPVGRWQHPRAARQAHVRARTVRGQRPAAAGWLRVAGPATPSGRPADGTAGAAPESAAHPRHRLQRRHRRCA